VDDPTQCHDHPEVPDRWPAVTEVVAYRDRVREALLGSVDAVAARVETHLMAREGRIFSMVIEHELMHQETLLYMLQRLPLERKPRPAGLPPYVLGPGRPAGPVEVPAGPATLGARFDELPFGWDNEFSALEVHVPAFRVDATAVTNGQFRTFVEDGGYRRSDLWTDEDWVWRGHDGIEHPAVWELVDGAWAYRTLFDLLPIDQVADWPVYVSLAEAPRLRALAGRAPAQRGRVHRAASGPTRAAGRRTAMSASATGPPPRWARIPRARAPGVCRISSATAGSGRAPCSRACPASPRTSRATRATPPTSSTASTTS
jgi:formylglycine-generating enzyme required for sulfatase activity